MQNLFMWSILTWIQTVPLITTIEESGSSCKEALPVAISYLNRRPFEFQTDGASLSPFKVFKGRPPRSAFSRFVYYVGVENIDAATTAIELVKLLRTHGIPSALHLDRGSVLSEVLLCITGSECYFFVAKFGGS